MIDLEDLIEMTKNFKCKLLSLEGFHLLFDVNFDIGNVSCYLLKQKLFWQNSRCIFLKRRDKCIYIFVAILSWLFIPELSLNLSLEVQ